MEWFVDNLLWINLIVLLVVLIVIALVLNAIQDVRKYFESLKFLLRGTYVIDTESKKSNFRVDIYNRNLNDARITAFGFIYRDTTLDTFSSYLKDKNLPKDHKVIVVSRDYFSFEFAPETLADFVQNLNFGKYKTKSLSIFVTISSGTTILKTSSNIRSVIQRILKKRHQEHRVKIATIRKQRKLQEKLIRDQKRAEFWKKVRERWVSFWSRIKGKFRKRP